MKKIIFIIPFLLICSLAYPQSTGKIKHVLVDPLDGSILVKAEYKVNGNVVNVFNEICTLIDGKYMDSRGIECLGEVRYLNISGNNTAIIVEARKNVDYHAENMLMRIIENREFINTEKLKRLNELTAIRTSESIVANIKNELIGYEKIATQRIVPFKGKEIKVTYDQKNTVADAVVLAVE